MLIWKKTCWWQLPLSFHFPLLDYMLAKKKGLTLSWPIPHHMALETPQRLALEHYNRAPGEVLRIYSELIKWSDYLRITSNIKTLEAFLTFKLKVIPNHRAAPPLSDEDTRESEYFLFYQWVMHPEKGPFPTHCPSFLPALLFRHMLRFIYLPVWPRCNDTVQV